MVEGETQPLQMSSYCHLHVVGMCDLCAPTDTGHLPLNTNKQNAILRHLGLIHLSLGGGYTWSCQIISKGNTYCNSKAYIL